MSAHTAWRVGGPAELFLRVRATEDLLEAVRAAREQELPVFMLGGGTNILVGDGGIRGLVIENKVSDVRIEGTALVATAGTPMAHLAAVAARSGIAGLEFAATIPGTAGGAIHGNSGCWGTETADVLEQAVLADLDGNVRVVPATALEYGYRHSALQGTPTIVLQGTFRGQEGERQSIVRRIKEMANERLQKQPLNQPNSGSTFKNPPGDHAGRLADAVGAKGLRVGGAVVSEKHANFIITSAGATAADVRALIAEVQRRVHEQFGIELEPEVEFVGEWEA